jgi:hypothetical protein
LPYVDFQVATASVAIPTATCYATLSAVTRFACSHCMRSAAFGPMLSCRFGRFPDWNVETRHAQLHAPRYLAPEESPHRIERNLDVAMSNRARVRTFGGHELQYRSVGELEFKSVAQGHPIDRIAELLLWRWTPQTSNVWRTHRLYSFDAFSGLIGRQKRHYNNIRPNSRLGNRQPARESTTPPLRPSGSVSLHLQPTMAKASRMH